MNPLIKTVDSYLKRSSAVLELGCGDGALISKIADAGYPLKRIVAVDLYNKPESLPQNVEFVKQDLERLDLEGLFDLVILNHVFEHIKNPLGLIEKIKTLLAPHGRILIVVPNRRGFGNEARVYLPEHGKHYFLWDKESLEYSLNRLGFICRFHNLYKASSRGGLSQYIPALLRLQNPNLICVAMLDRVEG